MKLTKSQLKKIIKEELENISEIADVPPGAPVDYGRWSDKERALTHTKLPESAITVGKLKERLAGLRDDKPVNLVIEDGLALASWIAEETQPYTPADYKAAQDLDED